MILLLRNKEFISNCTKLDFAQLLQELLSVSQEIIYVRFKIGLAPQVFFFLTILFFDIIAIAIAEKKGEDNEKKSLKDAYIISCETPYPKLYPNPKPPIAVSNCFCTTWIPTPIL